MMVEDIMDRRRFRKNHPMRTLLLLLIMSGMLVTTGLAAGLVPPRPLPHKPTDGWHGCPPVAHYAQVPDP
jgi:hypothetical protein